MKLFPRKYVELADLTKAQRDCISGSIQVRITFWGRILLLISGRAWVDFKITTENVIGEHKMVSALSVAPPNFLAIERQTV